MQKARKAEKQKEELRKLALLPGNKTCMHCPVRGPLYAVIDFNIFVCTQCSAIHRSLQHKVKGISMSEFADEEVAGMRVGGNERAAKIWCAGFKAGVPREGDERAIRNNIMTCFVERRYFNANEHELMQHEQIQASLPPVTGLPSGITLQAVPSTAPPPTAPPPTAPTTVASTVTVTPQAGVPAPVANSAVVGGVVQGRVISTAAPSLQQKAPHAGGFDDFFSGSQPTPTPQSASGTDFFSSQPAAPAPARSAVATVDFFGNPVSNAPPQSHPPRQVTANTDFFGGASSVPTSSTQAQQQQRSSATSVSSAANDDFFGGFSGSSAPTQSVSSYSQAPTRPTAAGDDFFGTFSNTPSAQPSFNASTTVAMAGSNPSNTAFFNNVTPQGTAISLARKEPASKTDAFADLYSFK